VMEFSKKDYAWVDMMDNFRDMETPVFARNATYDIAKKVGWRYFLMLDDDLRLVYRYKDGNSLRTAQVKSMDEIMNAYLKFLKAGGKNFALLGFGSAKDSIGGKLKPISYEVLHSMMCDVENRTIFMGTMNEDTTCSMMESSKGRLTPKITNVVFLGPYQGVNEGGLHDMYAEKYNDYFRNFYSVMAYPSGYKYRWKVHRYSDVKVVPEECKK